MTHRFLLLLVATGLCVTSQARAESSAPPSSPEPSWGLLPARGEVAVQGLAGYPALPGISLTLRTPAVPLAFEVSAWMWFPSLLSSSSGTDFMGGVALPVLDTRRGADSGLTLDVLALGGMRVGSFGRFVGRGGVEATYWLAPHFGLRLGARVGGWYSPEVQTPQGEVRIPEASGMEGATSFGVAF